MFKVIKIRFMSWCPYCNKMYDESEYAACPYCGGDGKIKYIISKTKL